MAPFRPSSNVLVWFHERSLEEKWAPANVVTDCRVATITSFAILHALALIELSPAARNESTAEEAIKDDTSDAQTRRVLYRHARMHVWAYGFKFRSSKSGAIVAFAGCLAVMAQCILGFIYRRRYRSPTELLVTALEHAPCGEFVGVGERESEFRAARFQVLDDDDDARARRLSFFDV